MTDTPATFGSVLRRRRINAGLTVRELSKRAGLHLTYTYRLESGACKPSLEVAVRLAGVIGCNVNDFLNLPE